MKASRYHVTVIVVSAPLSHPTLAARFGLVLQGLRDAISQRAATRGLSATPRLVLLWSWLSRLAQHFERIMTTPPRPRTPAAKPRAGERTDRPVLPRGPRWLRAAMPGHHLPGYASQLRHLLADPEMAELLARDPRMVRLLRPLCRRLGIRAEPELPACLFPPPRPRPPKPRPEPVEPAARAEPPPSVPSRFPRPRRRQYPNLPDLGERWPDLPPRQLRRWRPPKP